MNFKKVSTLFVTGAMVAAMSVAGFADDYADGTAYICASADSWAVSYTTTTVDVTADGTYTLEATSPDGEAHDLDHFLAVEIMNGETIWEDKYPFYLTIDSVEINGAAVDLQGVSFTCSKDGKGETTRTNIFNEWNGPNSYGVAGSINDFDEDGFSDARVAEVKGNETATLLTEEQMKGVKDIKVTFTVSGLADDAQPDGDVAPIAYLAALVAVAGIAMVASKKRA